MMLGSDLCLTKFKNEPLNIQGMGNGETIYYWLIGIIIKTFFPIYAPTQRGREVMNLLGLRMIIKGNRRKIGEKIIKLMKLNRCFKLLEDPNHTDGSIWTMELNI